MNAEQIAAELYDHTVVDWPGEIRFYEQMAVKARTILEVACGTRRVGLRLATAGRRVLGFDISPHMLAIATAKASITPTQSGYLRTCGLSNWAGASIL
jgi:ubiquinone/menaquinone biosynthesis C-methylase UbiE